ncbi:MAG: ATP-binding cassette domain-containing protein [Lawsonibacter sp.]
MEPYQIRDLTFAYPGQNTPALSHVSLTVERGAFFTLFGPSGGGKTTLLRQLKPALAPHGTLSGSILFQGCPLEQLDPAVQASSIGFVLQSPEEQIVTDKVWHELAFGLESLGLPRNAIRTRVAEMAAFFGIEDWFHRDTASLSGGQKQLLNLAAVMVMGPEVLLLDEPTSQLDPIAAQTFLDCLARLNRELGTTILLSEHRLEDALPLSTRCALLDRGQLLFHGTPRAVGDFLREERHPMFRSMPTPMRVWAAAGCQSACPVTPGEGRRWLEERLEQHPSLPLPPLPSAPEAPPALAAKEVWFRYDRAGSDVLRGLTFSVPKGSLYAILGGNGAGKTTLFSLLTGAETPQRGTLSLLGRPLDLWPEKELFQNALAVLPQNPKSLFVGQTVAEDLADMGASPSETGRMITLCGLNDLLDCHPYDLSGGEQQRAALAKVLLARPKVLLLDEPTKGMDAPFKETFAALLADLRREGVTVLMASHDVEFCARYATCCALLFDGTITAVDEPHAFFSQNRFYTTAACRMARGLIPGAVTAEELTLACGGAEDALACSSASAPPPVQTRSPSPAPAARHGKRLPKPLGSLLLALLLLSGYLAWRGMPLLAGLAAGHWLPSLLWLGGAAFGLWLLGLGRAAPKPPAACSVSRPQRTRWPTVFVLLILIPLTLLSGTYLLGDRKYYFISLLLLLEILIPMLLRFEGTKPQSRELVVLASLTALAAAGRAAFFMLPQFKPVAAVAILSGVVFGGQAGFMVGASSMLVSNFFYVQGAWTPWQMAAMGLIGGLAGWLGRWLGRGRLRLCLYGFLSVILLYGGILNPASVLMYQPYPTWEMLATSWLMGFPLDLVHGAATAFFLWTAGPAFLEKLNRIKLKYGLDNSCSP